MFDLGVTPHFPIRKKAWHRAHNNGRLWIWLPHCQFKNVTGSTDGSRCCIFKGNKYKVVKFDKYCPDDMGYITWPFDSSCGVNIKFNLNI